MSTDNVQARTAELSKVQARIAELSAELDQCTEGHFARLAGLPDPSDGPREFLLAQARVELAVYTGAMKSVGALFQRAVEAGDHDLATQASTVMTDLEESFALARATVNELLREDTHAV